MKQLTLKLYGNVQGVGFRQWLTSNAQSLGLAGFAKNEADGSVSVVAQGDKKGLEKFMKMCYDGPNFAQITHVTPQWQEVEENFRSFEIL